MQRNAVGAGVRIGDLPKIHSALGVVRNLTCVRGGAEEDGTVVRDVVPTVLQHD